MNLVLESARDSGDADLLATPTNVVGRALFITGQIVRAEHVLAQAATLLEQTADWPEWVFAVAMHGVAVAWLGNPAQGEQECRRALARAQEIKSDTAIAHAYMGLALVTLQSGDYEQMRAAGDGCIQAAARVGDHLLTVLGHSYRAWALARLGRYGEAEGDIAMATQAAARFGEGLIMADVLAPGA